MLMKFFPIAFALAISIGVMAEVALTNSKVFTVAGAIKDADTAVVTITGRVKEFAPNRFVLRDSTGACELQTCPTWYRPIVLTPNEKITVTGQVIKNISASHNTLYPLAVQSIKRDGRPDIVVREGIGRPPWVSMRR